MNINLALDCQSRDAKGFLAGFTLQDYFPFSELSDFQNGGRGLPVENCFAVVIP